MDNRRQVITNFLWRFFERCGAQAVTFVVTIVLARILNPEVYGTVALVMVFITIMQTFVDSGMGNALIQKKNADDIDFSSMFYFNMVMCTTLYFALFFAAPLIAKFYNIPELTSVIRVMGLILIVSGLKNVQQAYVSRNMLFKKFFFATLGGTIGAAIIGITLALLGAGVWALVAQYLFNAVVDTLILWITVKWRPIRAFSFYRLKGLFKYGWKLLVSGLIDKIYDNLYNLIIGKKYTASDLAYYHKGNSFPSILVENINSSINSVLFPVLSKKQDDKIALRSMMRRAIKTSSYIMLPLMMGLAMCAEPLIRLLLTDKWIMTVPFLRAFCFVYAFYPIHTTNLNAIKALGRSDIFLKLEILKKIVGIIIVVITMQFGVLVMAYGLVFTSIVSQIINAWPNKRLLQYSYFQQIKDILPSIILSIIMGCSIYPIQFIGLPDIVTLCIQVLLGAAIYIIGSKLFKLESFTYLWSMVKPVIFRLKKKQKN